MPKGIYASYRDVRAKQYKLKLTYFNGRGRAEHIRLLLAAAGLDYVEDNRIAFEDWPKLKTETPFGTLPMIEADGERICGSGAVARLIARIGELDGANYLEQCQVEAIADLCVDIREIFVGVPQAKPEVKEEKLKEAMEKATPMLKNLEKLLANKEFFVGEKLSYADIQFYATMELVVFTLQMTDYLKPYPCLDALYKRVATCPNIAAYLKTRPETPF